ncbi:phosphopantetheine-binding protein [Paraburkholderia phenazinium]|jgi:act minimal PKS acyl carrier protein|uniref:phosphopantetheine-binding protein n=1 Tax=Paraburkholderia phenazinium TaxID=60549 RepID=UPI00158D2530|nr:phosphopantetheine-binding protein [Paraburkholderia phenazinium]
MATFELENLLALLRNSEERDESVAVEVNASHADQDFAEIGFDSLALFNIVAEVEREYSIQVGYDDLMSARTPNQLLSLIQRRLAGTTQAG